MYLLHLSLRLFSCSISVPLAQRIHGAVGTNFKFWSYTPPPLLRFFAEIVAGAEHSTQCLRQVNIFAQQQQQQQQQHIFSEILHKNHGAGARFRRGPPRWRYIMEF